MADRLQQPSRSATEAYAQYDRIKAQAAKLKSAKPPTLLNKKP